MKRATRAGVAAALAALAAPVLLASPAVAHTELLASTPADGATVTELALVSLEFTGTVLEVGAEIVATDSTGIPVPLEVSHPAPTVVEAAVPGLANGDVEIEWRVVAEDGHPVEGTLAVTLDAPVPSPDPSPSPSRMAVTLTAEPAPPSATPDAISAPEATGDAQPWVWGLVGLAIVGAGAAVFLAAARRGSGHEWDEQAPPADD